MATFTSLYLCNQNVHAAVGSASRNRVQIQKVCHAELPEGCLINGVITNETALAQGLQAFFSANGLSGKKVALTLSSSQFLVRMMTLPAMPEKKLRVVIQREFASAGECAAPLDDYLPLSHSAAANTDTLLAIRIDKPMLDPYIALAQELGWTIHSIDVAQACEIKLVRFLPALREKTFLLLVFDGENLYSTLYDQGAYKHAIRSRLFNTRGTAESGAEITQKVSGLVQFHISSKGVSPITDVYFAGATDADLVVCTPGIEALQLQISPFPDAGGSIKMPQGCPLYDNVFTIGNLIGR